MTDAQDSLVDRLRVAAERLETPFDCEKYCALFNEAADEIRKLRCMLTAEGVSAFGIQEESHCG